MMIDNYVEVLKEILQDYDSTLEKYSLFTEDLKGEWDKLRLAFRNKAAHRTQGAIIVTKDFASDGHWIIATRIYADCKSVYSETESINIFQQPNKSEMENFVKRFFDEIVKHIPSENILQT